jgi:hypothetical protein
MHVSVSAKNDYEIMILLVLLKCGKMNDTKK